MLSDAFETEPPPKPSAIKVLGAARTDFGIDILESLTHSKGPERIFGWHFEWHRAFNGRKPEAVYKYSAIQTGLQASLCAIEDPNHRGNGEFFVCMILDKWNKGCIAIGADYAQGIKKNWEMGKINYVQTWMSPPWEDQAEYFADIRNTREHTIARAGTRLVEWLRIACPEFEDVFAPPVVEVTDRTLRLGPAAGF